MGSGTAVVRTQASRGESQFRGLSVRGDDGVQIMPAAEYACFGVGLFVRVPTVL